MAEADIVKVTWHLRQHNTSGQGAQWGVAGQIYPIDWSVSRTVGRPATAQIVIDQSRDYEINPHLLALLNGTDNQTWGVSCFREDFPEGDDNTNDPVFFGVITMVDIPGDGGPITIQASDFSTFMDGYLVDDVDLEAHDALAALNGLAGAFTQKYPRAHGVIFHAEHNALLPAITCKYTTADLMTLADVVHDYLASHPGIYLTHKRGVSLDFWRWDGSKVAYDITNPLAITSITRQFDTRVKGSIYRLSADNHDGQRQVSDVIATTANDASQSAIILQAPQITDQLRQAIAEHGATPHATARVADTWRADVPIPWPGERGEVTMKTATPDHYNEIFRSPVTVEGVITSITITPFVLTFVIDANPIGN